MEIHVTDKCPQDCLFCSVKKHQEKDPSFDDIKNNIKLSSKFDKLIISGGEPLLRRDIIDIIKFAKKYQKNVSVETNFIFANKDLIKKIINSKLNELKISFHSNDKLSYQKITRSKNFEKLVENLELIKSHKGKIRVTTNTVITKYNYLNLDQTVEFLRKNFPFISEIRISYPRFYPLKGCKNYSKRYLIPLERLRKSLKNVDTSKVIFENIPLCVLDSKKAEKVNWDIKLIKNGKIFPSLEGRYFPEKCDKCKKNKKCQGLHKHYSLYFDENFVKPFIS